MKKLVCCAVITVCCILPFIGCGSQSIETGALASSADALPELPDYQSKWMNASINERILLSEEIGESGAEQFAKSKGWEQILGKADKTASQGIDQAYRSSDGLLHVVEAKGGTSPLGNGYGYQQGTSEWAVEASKATCKNHAASEAEKRVAREVLQSASKGKLVVHVIRTEHVLGKPGLPVVESTLKTTSKAIKLAKQSLDAVTRVAKSPKGAAMLNAAKPIAKAAPVVGTATEAVIRGYDSYETERDYSEGKITHEERVENHAGNAGGCVGGVAGASGGAAVGAAVGSVVPGPGTAVGAAVGGVAGYIGGDYIGEKAGRAAANAAM